MLKLNFIVTEETVRLDKSKENSKTPSGNINNIECSFELPEEYNGLNVKAVFNGIPRPIENGKCIAPYIAAGECVIGVIAYSINEKDEYDLLSSPQPCVLYFPDGSYDENITADAQPSPSELELYYEKVERLIKEKMAVDIELSPDSNNAIANSAVTKVLDGGKLLGFEVITNYADYSNFEEHSSKYTEGLTNGGYVLILTTNIIYEDDDISDESKILLAQGIYVAKDNGEALLGVGIDTIQELIDELDTRYLSYEEYQFFVSALAVIVEDYKNKLNNANDRIDELKKKSETLADNSVNVVSDNTEYSGANISKLAIEYPEGDFECYISLTFAQEGDITVTLPESKYIGTPPVFANGEYWELSIKNGVVVGGKIE